MNPERGDTLCLYRARGAAIIAACEGAVRAIIESGARPTTPLMTEARMRNLPMSFRISGRMVRLFRLQGQ